MKFTPNVLKSALRTVYRCHHPSKALRFLWIFLSIAFDRWRGRKILIFHIGTSGQVAYIAPLINELRSRSKILRMYFSPLISASELERECAVQLGLCPNTLLGTYDLTLLEKFSKIDAFITPTQWVPCDIPGDSRICIFHGQPSKGNTFPPELIRKFNILFLLGPLQESLYSDFKTKYPEISEAIQTFRIGYPKTDKLLSGGFPKAEVLNKLKLPIDRPVVLFAPAYDSGSSLDMYGEAVIEQLLASDSSIVVKLHPMHYDPPFAPSGIDWPARLKRFEKHPGFRHVGNSQLDPFLAACDLFVTDFSGAAFECIALDKPVIFIDCPDFFQRTLEGSADGMAMYMRNPLEVLNDIRANAGRSAGLVVSHPNELPAAISRSVRYPEEFSSRRRVIASQLLYNEGRGTTTAVETILKLIGLT